MFDASKSVDAALVRERYNGGSRSDLEVLQQILAEVEYCEASGLQQDTTPYWRAEVERRLGEGEF